MISCNRNILFCQNLDFFCSTFSESVEGQAERVQELMNIADKGGIVLSGKFASL